VNLVLVLEEDDAGMKMDL